ncbi:Heparan sulfate glucosamine 3-O-sulfotransferase 5 [Mactra antiquata]
MPEERHDALQGSIKKSNYSVKIFVPENKSCIKRPPGAIIIGVPRCGTRTLANFLQDHPNIAIKESDILYFDKASNRSLGWYIDQMPCSKSNQITIERTASYFRNEPTPERMYNWNQNVKLIITFKEPIERLISDYVGLKDEGRVKKNALFEDYCTIKNRTDVKRKAWAVGTSNYQYYMKIWLRYFKLEQILIFNGTNFIANPSNELTKVEDFLGIGNYFKPDRFVFNTTKGKYCIIRNGKPSCMSKRKGRPHPNVDPNVRHILQNYYKPFNEQFFEMIGKRFEWGY